MKTNDNLPYEFPRCGAGNRRGKPCTSYAMKNGRCRFHGGLSTGPKTQQGKERSRRGNWKHGMRSAQAIAERKSTTYILKQVKSLLKTIRDS